MGFVHDNGLKPGPCEIPCGRRAVPNYPAGKLILHFRDDAAFKALSGCQDEAIVEFGRMLWIRGARHILVLRFVHKVVPDMGNL
jgi:hypothetical protein